MVKNIDNTAAGIPDKTPNNGKVLPALDNLQKGRNKCIN